MTSMDFRPQYRSCCEPSLPTPRDLPENVVNLVCTALFQSQMPVCLVEKLVVEHGWGAWHVQAFRTFALPCKWSKCSET